MSDDDLFYSLFPAFPRPRDPQLEAELQQLWAMSPDERIAAMRAERLTLHQLSAWSARHPEQVPKMLTGVTTRANPEHDRRRIPRACISSKVAEVVTQSPSVSSRSFSASPLVPVLISRRTARSMSAMRAASIVSTPAAWLVLRP